MTTQRLVFCMNSFFICLLLLSCGKQSVDSHITARIIKNDTFKGVAIADKEYIQIEEAIRLLFKDAPLQAGITDTIVQTLHNNKLFSAETNEVSLMFSGGVIKDSVAILLQRDLSAFKRHDFLIQAPENINYTLISKTKSECSIKATEMTSNGNVSVGINNDKIYRLDTLTGNFYDENHNILANVRGIKSYSAPGIYKVSYTIYNSKKEGAVKSIVYDTRNYHTDNDMLAPHCIRSGK
jgi:hypothetical protein